MYFCARKREKRYRYLVKGTRGGARIRRNNNKSDENDIVKEPCSSKDFPDSIAIPEAVPQCDYKHQKDFEVFLHARKTGYCPDGRIELKITSVSISYNPYQ